MSNILDGKASYSSWEKVIAIVITGFVVMLHLNFIANADGLWRDEINSLNMASFGSISKIIKNLHFDSFPILHLLAIRGWISLSPFDSPSESLRLFGLCIGLTSLGVLWMVARIFGHSTPLVAIFLLGLNPVFIQIADSVRPYGLAALLGFITFGCYWLLIIKKTTARFLLAVIAGVLFLQCLYQNALLVGGICFASVTVCMIKKQWMSALLVTLAGLITLLTLLPYVPIVIRAREWAVVAFATESTGTIKGALVQALGGLGFSTLWIWGLFGMLGTFIGVSAIWDYKKRTNHPKIMNKDAVIYSFVALVVCGLSYIMYIIQISGIWLQPWHYTPMIAIAAVSLDTILGSWKRWVVPKIVFCLVFFLALAPGSWKGVSVAQTNMGLIASSLEKKAHKLDLILVYPWYLGVAFNYYYSGETTWFTTPPLEDVNIHRFDLLKNKMMEESPMLPVLHKVREVLNGGHTVWVVGSLPTGAKKDLIEPFTPAPHPRTGWQYYPYVRRWGRELLVVLSDPEISRTSVNISKKVRVNGNENPTLESFKKVRLR